MKKKIKKSQKHPPFTCVIHGAGIDIDIAIEGSRNVGELATKIAEAIGLKKSETVEVGDEYDTTKPMHNEVLTTLFDDLISTLQRQDDEQLSHFVAEVTRLADVATKECLTREEAKSS